MSPELVEDRTPINVGIIVIDDYQPRRFNDDGFIDYQTFTYSALTQLRTTTFGAEYAQRYSVQYLIAAEQLPILPPKDAIAGEQPWGPYDPHDYFIEAEAFVHHAASIENFAADSTRHPVVIAILRDIRERAETIVRHNTDAIPYDRLPGAFTTERWPKLRIENGDVVTFVDFQRAASAIQTSPGKICAVFDRLIEVLGDDEARAHISKLKTQVNTINRKYIRETSFIKTQAIADFINRVGELKEESRVFNDIGVKILRFVLLDE